jgi:2-alkyl-3-oxoalkanoate reductase
LKVLVTGAGGFLGRYVVAALLQRGHSVRVLTRPTTRIDGFAWADQVDKVVADLRGPCSLAPAFNDVEALVHLAARVGGSPSTQMADTVVGTELLLETMAGSATRRLVLASSFSVYDWSKVRGTLTEESPLETNLYERDGYAIAKTWQERTARRLSLEHNWDLSVLRPGFIWGTDHGFISGLGQKLGRWHLVIGPATRLPLTYVENCADCFALAVENPRAAGATLNVVDGHEITSWRYVGEYLRRTSSRGHRIPVPYTAALTAARLADWTNRRICKGKARLPGLLIPCRLQARFKPVRVSTQKLEEVLGWKPPWDFAQCLRRAFEAPDPLGDLPNTQRRYELQNV